MSHSGSGDTGTISIDVSVPTDLTVTSGDSELPKELNTQKQVKHIQHLTFEVSQLQHANERLKLEVQEKDAKLTTFRAQYSSLLNQRNFENDAKISEKQAVINRLDGELTATNDELKLLKERAAKELAHLLQKCMDFQQNQARLAVKHEEIKSTLENLILSEEEFYKLRSTPDEDRTLKEFVSLRVFELVMPLKTKVKELELVKSSLENTIKTYERELSHQSSDNSRLADEISSLREKLLEYTSRCDDLRKEMKTDDFRVYNFERIKRERDLYEEEITLLSNEKRRLDLALSVCEKEKKNLNEQNMDLGNKVRNLEKESSQYKIEFTEAKTQLEKLKDDAKKSASHVKSEQQRSEDLHEKFLASKTEVITLTNLLQNSEHKLKTLEEKYSTVASSENKLKDELDALKIRFNELKVESENIGAKYTKEKDILKLDNTEIKANYNALWKNYNISLETNSNLLKENQQYHKTIKSDSTAKEEEIMKLKQETLTLRKELNSYKELETEYLTSLKAFASVDQEEASGSNRHFSTVVKGKLSQETMSLTKRILRLERENTEALSVIKAFTSSLDEMRAALCSYKAVLALSDKPNSSLLDKIRRQEEQIILLEEALNASGESKSIYERNINVLKGDLETVHSYVNGNKLKKEDLASVKKELFNLRNVILKVGK